MTAKGGRVGNDLLHRQTKTAGGNRQVRSLEFQGWNPNNIAQQPRDECGGDQGQQERHFERDQKAQRVRTHGKETGMSERDLPGETHQQIQANGSECVDHKQGREVGIGGRDHRQQQQRQDEDGKHHPALQT